MVDVLLYFLAFLVGVFTVWRVGRSRYYDEERLIDLVVFSSLVGVLTFWGLGEIGGRGFQVGDYLDKWRVPFSVFLFSVFSIYYIKRLRWGLWPSLGFLWLGASAAWVIIALVGVGRGQPVGGAGESRLAPTTLVISLLTFLFAYYIVVGGGDAWLMSKKNNLRSRLSSWRNS